MLGARTSRPQRASRREVFVSRLRSFSRFALIADETVRVPSNTRLLNSEIASVPSGAAHVNYERLPTSEDTFNLAAEASVAKCNC